MNRIAIKMLVGDRAKYLGIIMGITFASLLITQQAAIFTGLMTRTYSAITDLALPDIWVMDPKVQFIDDIKPMQSTKLLNVRGVEGVEWAVPLYKGLLKARLDNGNFQTVNVIGLDDATLIGGPPAMIAGKLADLRRNEGVIVDEVGAADKLAKPAKVPGGRRLPLGVGDTLEINDRRATVVGISHNSRTFQSQPIVYTTYSRALGYAPPERRLLSFVLVKAKSGQNLHELCARITRVTGLAAYTREQFEQITVDYFMKYTGIPINFGIAVVLGFIVGTAIAGQTFYNFTLDNLRQFGALKAMGAQNGTLLKMILLQAVVVGLIGYGLGVGLASFIGYASRGSELAFRMPWQLLAISGTAVAIICTFTALLSIWKVVRLEPAIVFKG
jgi:putative ABC transport system permease protein